MDFKFKTSFSSALKPLVSEEKDKYLALASLKDIGSFIPNIDTKKDIDLLPVAFNACVVNRVNKNGDVIDTATALEIYKNFINKPINVEHNRQRIIGTILTAGFSAYGTDLPIQPEELIHTKQPFNITLGGVLWKIVNPDLAEKIEDSNDENSEDYQSISASWELGFSEYAIVSNRIDSKNLEDCEEESDPMEYDKYLKSNGGPGKTKDGKSVFRKVVGAVVPLGIGLTENPAADVKGVVVPPENEDLEEENEEEDEEKEDNQSEGLEKQEESEEGCSKNISQSSNFNVKLNSDKIMKITSLEDINEANWKEISASAVTQFVAEQLKTANEEFLAKKAEHDNFVKATEESAKKAQEDYASLKATLDSLQAELAKFAEEKANREQIDIFNARMSDMCSAYELTEEMLKVVAAQVKTCKTDEDFGAYKTSMEVFLKPFEKKAQSQAEASTKEEAKEQAKEKESHASVVDDAVDNSEKEKVSIPNSIETKKPTIFEKYSQAFSLEDGFVVNKNRR